MTILARSPLNLDTHTFNSSIKLQIEFTSSTCLFPWNLFSADFFHALESSGEDFKIKRQQRKYASCKTRSHSSTPCHSVLFYNQLTFSILQFLFYFPQKKDICYLEVIHACHFPMFEAQLLIGNSIVITYTITSFTCFGFSLFQISEIILREISHNVTLI